MKQVIAITGASSDLGELASHELAKAGHVVYAGVSAGAPQGLAGQGHQKVRRAK